jgi:hypothetical protein
VKKRKQDRHRKRDITPLLCISLFCGGFFVRVKIKAVQSKSQGTLKTEQRKPAAKNKGSRNYLYHKILIEELLSKKMRRYSR